MTIDITLKDNRKVECLNDIIGKTYENKETTLKFYLTKEMATKDFYIEFEKPDGTKFMTERLDITSMYDSDGINDKFTQANVEYEIPNSLLDLKGELKIEAVLRADDKVWKSYTLNLYILNSINASEEVAEQYPDFISEAQKVLDQVQEMEQGKAATIQLDEVITLEPSEEAYVVNIGDENNAKFKFGIPKGESGVVNFATFDIEDGNLVMNKSEEMNNVDFEINNDGYLEVIING